VVEHQCAVVSKRVRELNRGCQIVLKIDVLPNAHVWARPRPDDCWGSPGLCCHRHAANAPPGRNARCIIIAVQKKYICRMGF